MARSNNKTRKKKKQRKGMVLNQSSRPAKPLFRLIPLTMTMAGALLCLKTVEIYQSGRSLSDELFVSSVMAEDPPAAAAPAASADAVAGAEDAATAAPAAEAVAAPPVDIVERRSSEFNVRELDVLENLAARRKKLDELEKDISLREKVLKATEDRIDQKLTELNGMSKELKDLLVTYDKEENAKVSSLVKVYEAMKPKDAARIFDELDMDILLLVVDRMSERRVAPVLAAMSPSKAKDLTQQLADQQKSKPAAAEELRDSSYSPPLF